MYTWFDDAGAPALMGDYGTNVRNMMRLLWAQHGEWTRMAIISIVFALPDEKQTTERLLRNPADFAKVFQHFYGKEWAAKFQALLTDHLVIAVQLVKAAKAGKSKEAENIENRWYANAADIAVLLSSVNPYWPVDQWKAMLFNHLRLLKFQVVTLLSKEYSASIGWYDKYELELLDMADFMAYGIIRQFQYSYSFY